MAKNETAKTFVIAGISTTPEVDGAPGVKTFRFANGALNLRVNMLNHKGHSKVNLVELPRPMTQKNAMAWLLQNVRGTKGAVIATRSADKHAKSDVVIEAEELAEVH